MKLSKLVICVESCFSYKLLKELYYGIQKLKNLEYKIKANNLLSVLSTYLKKYGKQHTSYLNKKTKYIDSGIAAEKFNNFYVINVPKFC